MYRYTPSSEPVGPLLYHLWIDGQQGRMATLGVLVSLISLLLVVGARRLTRGGAEGRPRVAGTGP